MLNDVVRLGVAQERSEPVNGTRLHTLCCLMSGMPGRFELRFKLCEEATACPINALMSAEEVSFFISAPAEGQQEILSRPFARAKFPRSVVATINNAEELQGKVVIILLPFSHE